MVKVNTKRKQCLIEKALQDSDTTGLLRAATNGSNEHIHILLESNTVDLNSKGPDGRTALSQASKHGHVDTVELLLNQHGVDSNSMDIEGRTPLSLASEQWHERVVESLIDRGGACTNLKDNRNRTPLHWTARKSPPSLFGFSGGTKESLPTVASLLSHNIEPDARDSKGRTALSRFAKYGHNEAVELLLKQDSVNPNSKDEKGRTPLSLAAEQGHTQIVDMLINGAGVDPDLKDDRDWTPLFWAIKGAGNAWYSLAAWNQGCDVMRLLLNRDDVDFAAQDKEGRTPLSWAVESPHLALEICEVLLKRRNDTLEMMGSHGLTPFSRAKESGKVQLIRKIVEQDRTNLDFKDKDGRTPLSRAAQCGRVGVMELLLMDTSIDPDSKDNRGRTPLWWAADCGQARSVKLLLETSGVDPESTDDEDCTPLLCAAKHGKEEVILQLMRKDRVTLHMLASRGDISNLQLLLNRGCNAGVRNKSGRTPLHSAALFGHANIVKELLTRDAIADCKDNGGKTPLHLAIRNQRHAIIDLLFEHSAETPKILLDEWFTAYNRSLSDDVLELSQLADGKKFIQFNQEGQAQLWIKPELTRRIFVFRSYSTWYEYMACSIHIFQLDLPGLLHIMQTYDEHISVLLIGSFPIKHDSNNQEKSVLLQWHECAIAWTMVFSATRRDWNGWRSMHHYSTLPYGWIPRNGTEFFSLFIQHLRESWHKFCISAEEHLLQRRLHQMNSKGNSAEFIDRLAEDLKNYAEVRKVFRGQIRSTRNFVTEYSERYDQEKNAQEMTLPIKEFEENIGEMIDQLDQTVKDLLQFEFAWVSINEAHRSATIATSMKRLSWITFVFLPAMFTSSLFGMNVDILETNPDWRWYLLFSGGCLTLTVLVWLFFKHSEIKQIIQRHPSTGSLDLFRGFTRHNQRSKIDQRTLPL